MRVINLGSLIEFYENRGFRDSKKQLESWLAEVKAAKWKTPHEIPERYPTARNLGNNRFVFKICGNKYRLIAEINFSVKIVIIRFIGTHSEYDRIDAKEI